MMKRLERLSAHVVTSAVASEFESDPFPKGMVPAGTIAIYGQPTSRVVKVLWLCGELGLPYEQVSYFCILIHMNPSPRSPRAAA
jgi:hypothetical protein